MSYCMHSIFVLAICSLLTYGVPVADLNLNFANDDLVAVDEKPLEFLLELLQCLKTRRDGQDLADTQCVPNVFEDQDEMEDAIHSNTVWGFVGNVSCNETSMMMSFKINQESGIYDLNSLDLRVYKNRVEQKDIVNTCDLNQGVQLSLYTTTSNKTLIQNINLTYNGLQQEKWLAFRSLNNSWLSSNSSLEYFAAILEISSEGCDELSLENIGISAQTGKEPLLIVYAERKQTNDEEMLKHLLEQSSDISREKRDTSTIIQETSQCTLYNYNVNHSIIYSFVPGQFQLNYCAGQCIYPLSAASTSTNHAMLLAYLQFPLKESQRPPIPCCVAIEHETLEVIVKATDSMYVIHRLPNVTAVKCGCQ